MEAAAQFVAVPPLGSYPRIVFTATESSSTKGENEMLASWPLVILASTRRLQKKRTTPAVPVTESAGCRVGMTFTHTRERTKQSLVRHRPPKKKPNPAGCRVKWRLIHTTQARATAPQNKRVIGRQWTPQNFSFTIIPQHVFY